MKPVFRQFALNGKVALITGGSRGLGRAMALGFAEAGADVAIASRSVEKCKAVAEEIEAQGRCAFAQACHVGRWDDIERLVDAVYDRFGTIDILVNNAGKSPLYASLMDVTEALWDSTIGVNLKGAFRLSVLVGNRMKARAGGSIINISSLASIHPEPASAPYGAAKTGLNNLTLALAKAFAPEVRVNAIIPGAFMTDIAKAWDLEAYRDRARRRVLLQRIGEPEEIVGAALYFASDASRFVSGALLPVDGGDLGGA